MKNKKGITLQFHWIFILIAGGIILAFFFSVANKQKDLSEEKLSLSLVQSLDMIFEMAESSEGTSQVIPLPKKGIFLKCSKGCDCYFSTGNVRKSFGSNVIFSEENVDSLQASVWSLPWKTPFRACNMLYVSNPETRKILVFEDDSKAKDIENKLNDLIPENIIFEKIKGDEFKNIVDDGSKLTRIFLIGDIDVVVPQGLVDSDVELINIKSNLVIFFEKQGEIFKNAGALNIPKDITWILAAIFSADKNMFVCGMKSALVRLHNVVDVFYTRASHLQEDTADVLDIVCVYPLDQLRALNKTTTNVEVKTDIPLFKTIDKINSIKGGLKQKNNALIKHSCPELF